MALPLVAGYSCAVLAATWRPQPNLAPRLRWLTTVEASQVVPAMFCALLMGMALALTGSRSGVAGFAVAMLVFGYFAVRRLKERRARLLVGGYLLVIVVGAIAWAGTDMALVRFMTARSDSPGRLIAWRDALHIVTDFPWFGTGLGTFGKAMLVYQTASRPWMYAQAHNDYLQLLAEGGVLVAHPVARRAVARDRRHPAPPDGGGGSAADVVDPHRRHRRSRWDCGAIGRRVQSADAREHRAVRAAARDRDASSAIRVAAIVERARAPILHSRPCASRLISTASWPICTAHSWRRRASCIPSSIRPRSARRTSDRRRPRRMRRRRQSRPCRSRERTTCR